MAQANHYCGEGQIQDSIFRLGLQKIVFTQPVPKSACTEDPFSDRCEKAACMAGIRTVFWNQARKTCTLTKAIRMPFRINVEGWVDAGAPRF